MFFKGYSLFFRTGIAICFPCSAFKEERKAQNDQHTKQRLHQLQTQRPIVYHDFWRQKEYFITV